VKSSEEILKDFKSKYPTYEVIYLSLSGSKLYGTDGPDSDEDYKGIFIPPKEDVLLKEDIEHYTTTTGNDSSRNGADDIDVQLWSVYKFMNLLKKGETGALDLLFSMLRSDTQILSTDTSNQFIKELSGLLHTKVHSFVGYCIGQSKKYNIKGERYNELVNFINVLDSKLEYNTILEMAEYKFIKLVQAPGPRGNKGQEDIPYISVLGKLFDTTLDRKYILDKLISMEKQYGNRAKDATSSVDYKALSHAVRVLLEVKELLAKGTITFPLIHKDYIKSIKNGNEKLEDVMELIAEGIEEVDILMTTSSLENKPNHQAYRDLLLTLIG